jgi:hypothetical protein
VKSLHSALALLLLAPGLTRGQEPTTPFARTEDRPRCAHYSATRQPFFGQLHLHTQYSADAATLQTRLTPRDAYRFAQGEEVGLAPFFDTRQVKTDDSEPAVGGVSAHPYCLPPESCQFTATRTIRLPEGRALDFAAVTDHSEYLGETNICFFESNVVCRIDRECAAGQVCSRGTCVPNGYDSDICSQAREDLTRLVAGTGAALFVLGWQAEEPKRFKLCNDAGAEGDDTCTFQAKNVWQQIIAAAQEANDTSDQCRFTAFIGYEYTSMPAMKQCMKSFGPCFADADCGDGDTCAAPGQCSEPAGKVCFADSDCGRGATCVANGGGYNLHRNVIFRNANVPELPVTYFDAITGCGAGGKCKRYTGPNGDYPRGAFSTAAGVALGSPTVMLKAVQEVCNPDQEKPCEFLSIPHNSNLSGGAMFLMPESPEDARVRNEHERLVEIFQIKGGSECRYSRQHPDAWQPGAAAPDELCDFENMSFAALTGAFLIDPDARSVPASSYVRNALKDGLRYRQQHPEEGVNPFQLGFVGSLDNHNGTPTATEVDYSKFGAHGTNSFAAGGQMLNETFFLGLETNGGGVAVAWAEENSRDSIFAAMQRRETYATSGTRPVVRFFGGFDLPPGMCETGGDFAAQGYDHGVPMGGTLGAAGGKAPRFAVHALMDPGWEGHPGATLQRAQIVKGWVDAHGEVHEQVYDVAGGPDETVPVDLATCKPEAAKDRGLTHLCTVWTDPRFDPGQHVFYYARILENPSCRWNQYYCLDRGVDCAKPPQTGKDLVGYNANEYQQCCSGDVPKAVQQRAWTSPIWYAP